MKIHKKSLWCILLCLIIIAVSVLIYKSTYVQNSILLNNALTFYEGQNVINYRVICALNGLRSSNPHSINKPQISFIALGPRGLVEERLKGETTVVVLEYICKTIHDRRNCYKFK